MATPPRRPPEPAPTLQIEGPPTAADEGDGPAPDPTASLEEPPSQIPIDERIAISARPRPRPDASSLPSFPSEPGSLASVDLSYVGPETAPSRNDESSREKLQAIAIGLALGTLAGLVVVFALVQLVGGG